MRMKKIVSLIAGCVMMLLAFSCSEVEYNFPEVVSSSPLPGHFAGLEFYMDTTQGNRFNPDKFCQDWEFVSTQIEVWTDGKLTETRDVDNVFPYRSLSFRTNGLMSAQEMEGKWHYAYNFLMIDVLYSGGSIYWYEVEELTAKKMVLRAEDYAIGGPIVTFRQDPSGRHYFELFTYVKK